MIIKFKELKEVNFITKPDFEKFMASLVYFDFDENKAITYYKESIFNEQQTSELILGVVGMKKIIFIKYLSKNIKKPLIVKLLIEAAIILELEDIIEIVLEEMPKKMLKLIDEKSDHSILSVAIIQGNLDVLKKLINSNNFNINKSDFKTLELPINYAIYNNLKDIFIYLISLPNIELNTFNNNILSPLEVILTSKKINEELLTLLINSNNFDLTKENETVISLFDSLYDLS